MHTHLPAHLTAPCLLGLQCFQLLPASAQGASLHAVSLCPQPSFALQPQPAPTWSREPDLSSSSRAWQMPSSGSRDRSLLHRHEARPGHAALRAGQLHRFPAPHSQPRLLQGAERQKSIPPSSPCSRSRAQLQAQPPPYPCQAAPGCSRTGAGFPARSRSPSVWRGPVVADSTAC